MIQVSIVYECEILIIYQIVGARNKDFFAVKGAGMKMTISMIMMKIMITIE